MTEEWEKAKQDAKAYNNSLIAGDWNGLIVEERWGLYGAAPQQISEFLNYVAAGATRAEAMEAVFS